MKIVFTFVFVIFTLPALALDLSYAEKALGKFQEAKGVKAKVEKTAVYALLEETKKSSGEMIFAKGLLRLSVSAPDPSLIVMTDAIVWVETPAPSGEGKHVMKIVSKDMNKRSKAPLAMLLERKDVLRAFNCKSAKEENGNIVYELTPKKADQLPDVAKLNLVVAKKDSTLVSLSYMDEIENKVTYQFKKPNFSYEPRTKDFAYTPPKGSEVVVY